MWARGDEAHRAVRAIKAGPNEGGGKLGGTIEGDYRGGFLTGIVEGFFGGGLSGGLTTTDNRGGLSPPIEGFIPSRDSRRKTPV